MQMLGTATNTLHLLTLVHRTNKIFQGREGPHTKIEEHSRAYLLTQSHVEMRNALTYAQLHTQERKCAHTNTHTQTCIPPPGVK